VLQHVSFDAIYAQKQAEQAKGGGGAEPTPTTH
jgi:hypothetical protein